MAITISGENNNDRILAQDGVIDSLSGFNISGIITATSFTGNLTGNVVGDITGNVTGNVNNSTLLFQIGGSEKVRITSNGVLKLTGQSSSFETAGFTHHTNNNLYIRGGTTGLVMQSVDGNESWIVQNDYISGSTGGTERIKILSNGDVQWNNIGTTLPGVSNTTVGIGFEPRNGSIFLSRGSNATLLSNRNGDGRHLHFANNGTEKWAIGLLNTGVDFAISSGAGNSPTARLRLDNTGTLKVGGTPISESDMNWIHDTYQRPHFFTGQTGGNPSDGVLVVASPETNPSNTRVGSLIYGCKTSSTSGVSNSGIKAFISGHTNTNVSDAWKTGGYLSFSVRADNGSPVERMRLTSTGILRIERGSDSSDAIVINSTSSTQACRIKFDESGSTKAQLTYSHDNDRLELVSSSGNSIAFYSGGNLVSQIDTNGHFIPQTNNVHDLGSTTKGWRNVYMNDLNLSNMKGNKNDVDGTQGSWTIQEGKDNLYIINRLNGKKFKIKMEEII
tara:strand:+ start:428 stop:1939 length:1512 start_codon:yes stop_codon:yes gene_type:complete